MKFSRTVELPVWETGTDNLLKGERGILGIDDIRESTPTAIIGLLRELKATYPVLYDITAIDETERKQRPAGAKNKFTLQYLLLKQDPVRVCAIKVPLEDEAVNVPTATGVYPNANWYEREVYDMFGLKFEGHPDMTRILMPEWWEGYPLRKTHPGRATEMAPLVITERDLKEYDGYEQFTDKGDSIIRTKNEAGEEMMILNLGPNHPGTHGVLRIVLQLNGEYMEKCYPVIGYHHRGAEKIAERQTFHTYIPYCDRVDYLAGVNNELPYVMACEQLAGIEIPERAQMMRVLLCEMYRICNHLVWFGTFGHDVGAMTPVFYTFRERENVFKMIEMITGGRMHPNYLRIGGMSMDLPVGWQEPLKLFLKDFTKHLNEYKALLLDNPIFHTRTKDVGVMSLEQCLDWGVTGANLRASGGTFDVRKAKPYSGYEKFEFDIPTATTGDCYARAVVRHAEMYQSARILEQCINMMPEGDYISRDNRYAFPPRKNETMMDIEALINHFLAVGWGLDLPVGESFAFIESPKGVTGHYLISDGRTSPYRLRIRTPSFAHMQTLPVMCNGHLLSDLLAVIGAMDFVLADIDR